MLLMSDLSIAGSVPACIVLFQVLSRQTMQPLDQLYKVRIPILGSFLDTFKEFLICRKPNMLQNPIPWLLALQAKAEVEGLLLGQRFFRCSHSDFKQKRLLLLLHTDI